MSKLKIALNPKHPERICWGCDKYCSADDLRCGNGTIRTQHPVELFGEDWLEWELNGRDDREPNPFRPVTSESSSESQPPPLTCHDQVQNCYDENME